MSKRHPLDELFKQNLRDASAPVPNDMWDRIARARQQKRRRMVVVWSALGATTLSLLAILLLPLSPPELGHFPLEETASAPASNLVAEHPTTLPTEVREEEQLSTNTAASSLAQQSVVSTQNRNRVISAPYVSTKTKQQLNKVTPAATRKKTAVDQQETATTTAIPAAPTETVQEEGAPRIAGPHQRIRNSVVANLPQKDFAFTAQSNIKLFANHAPRCARFANPYFRFDLEILGGPAYAQQILQAKTPESISHLKQRQKSESPALSHSSGFRLAAASNVGLNLRTGLIYTQINDRFTFEVGSRMDVSTIFGPNGEIIGIDTIYTEAYEEQHRNRLKFIEIPLLLGYEQQVGKFRIGVNAGAYLNVHFGAKGAIYSPATQEPIDFGQQGDRNVLPIFEQRATAAWYAGMSIAYNLHSRYSLIAEPYFKSYPRALSSSEYDLQQNYWMTGMQVGMRMRL